MPSPTMSDGEGMKTALLQEIAGSYTALWPCAVQGNEQICAKPW